MPAAPLRPIVHTAWKCLSPTTRRARRAAGVALAAALLAVSLPSLTGLAQEGGNNQIRPTGRLARIGPEALQAFGDKIVPPKYFEPIGTNERRRSLGAAFNGTIIVLEQARQMWQFFLFGFPERTGVLVRDLDTLAVKHSLVYEGRFKRSTNSLGGEWMHATDGTRRLFLLEAGPVDPNALVSIVAFDLATFAVSKHVLGLPWTVNGMRAPGYDFAGLAYDPYEDEVVVASGVPNVINHLSWVDLESGQARVRPVRSCTGVQPSIAGGTTYGMAPLLLKDNVFYPCHRGGNVGTVVKLPRTGLFHPHGPEDLAVGPVSIETSFVDPVSERVFLLTVLGEIWAFDTRTMSFIGIVSAGSIAKSSTNIGMGIDPQTGRLFFLSPAYGVGVVEGRFFPIPQARLFPGLKALGQERIWSDHRTGRFFVLPGFDQDKAFDYTIFDAGTAPVPPPPPDPDRNTADTDEGPGTEARYFGSAGGYGFRALMAKGVVTIAPAPGAGVQAPTAAVINQNVNSKCGYTDRELVAGRVSRAEYDTGSSAATAVAVDVDQRTQQDLAHPSRCDVTARHDQADRVFGRDEVFSGIFATSPVPLSDQGRGWNYEPAGCTAGEGGEQQEATGEDNDEPSLGTSEVACPLPGGRLVASAVADATAGGVDVGYAATHVEIQRVPRTGIVSKATSVARNIDIAGVIRIAEVSSTATSRANGRPVKGNMSTYDTVIKGVVVGDVNVCEDVCDTGAVLDALNQAAAGRAQFRAATGIDEERRKGSPRGASTAVQKSLQRQVSDQALVGDSTNEVPGLEMTFYNDNTEFGRARQVYQFAGVTTTATYNVVPLPSLAALLDDDGPSRPDGLSLDSPPGDGTGGGLESLFPTNTAADRPSSGGSGLVAAIRRAVRAVGDGLALIVTDPRRAFLVLTAWMVIAAPAALSRRRRLLLGARS